MGVRIYWNGETLDMSRSLMTIKSQLNQAITGEIGIGDFIAYVDDAEEMFDIPNNEFPKEDKKAMMNKFKDIMKKEYLNKDLLTFVKELPDTEFGKELKGRLEDKSSIMEGKQVKDLYDTVFFNKLIGAGAMQYGRDLSGIPKHNYFEYIDSEERRVEERFDIILSETTSSKEELQNQKTGKLKITTEENPHNIEIQYPSEKRITDDMILESKIKFLEKAGIFNPALRRAGKPYSIGGDTLAISIDGDGIIKDYFRENPPVIYEGAYSTEEGTTEKGEKFELTPSSVENYEDMLELFTDALYRGSNAFTGSATKGEDYKAYNFDSEDIKLKDTDIADSFNLEEILKRIKEATTPEIREVLSKANLVARVKVEVDMYTSATGVTAITEALGANPPNRITDEEGNELDPIVELKFTDIDEILGIFDGKGGVTPAHERNHRLEYRVDGNLITSKGDSEKAKIFLDATVFPTNSDLYAEVKGMEGERMEVPRRIVKTKTNREDNKKKLEKLKPFKNVEVALVEERKIPSGKKRYEKFLEELSLDLQDSTEQIRLTTEEGAFLRNVKPSELGEDVGYKGERNIASTIGGWVKKKEAFAKYNIMVYPLNEIDLNPFKRGTKGKSFDYSAQSDLKSILSRLNILMEQFEMEAI